MGAIDGCFVPCALALAGLAAGALLLFRLWRSPSAWRSRAVNATLVALSLVAAFVAAEGVFFFFVDTTDGAMNLLTSKRWAERHTPKPRGAFRGRWLQDRPRAGGQHVTIAVVGDSVTFGQGVERDEDLYTSVLERELRARGVDAAVYNISLPGWDTAQETTAFVDISGLGQRFDVVVLGYCLNDIAPLVAASPAYISAATLIQSPPTALQPLLERSFVASYLYNRLVILASPAIRAAEGAVIDAYRRPEMFTEHVRQLNVFRQRVWWYGAKLRVLTFPHCSTPWERYPARDIHAKLDGFWRALGVPNYDLLPVFERYPVRDLQSGMLDSHPNELAHRLAGELLAERLLPELATARGARTATPPR